MNPTLSPVHRLARLLARSWWSLACAVSMAAWILCMSPAPPESGPVGSPQLRDHDVPPESYMMVLAYNKAGEVMRWSGPIDLPVAGPERFIATRGQSGWAWNPAPPGTLYVDSPDREQGGQPVHAWAESQGASRVVVLVIPYPGEPEDTASRTGTGIRGQGTGSGRGSSSSYDREREAGPASHHAVPEPSPHAPIADQVYTGAGKTGTGASRGSSQGSGGAGTGTHATGRVGGSPLGSESPSWVDNPRAEIARHGGRTPADHGRAGGSAGGQEGGSGAVRGAGWLNVLDVPETVAPAVAAALIVYEADIGGFGQKLFNRTVRGLARQGIDRELREQARAVVERRVSEARARMEAARPEAPPAEHIDEIMAYMPEEVELAFYRDLSDLAHHRVGTYSRAIERMQHARDDIGQHVYKVTRENHAAWQEIGTACDGRIQSLRSASAPAAATTSTPGAAVRSPTAVSTPAHTIGSSAGKGGLTPVLTGLRGEARVRAVYNIGPRKMIEINGRKRVPDGVTEKVLTEVKNVKEQSFTEQLKDYLAISQKHNLEFHLFVRIDTELSEPLDEAMKNGLIKLRYIP